MPSLTPEQLLAEIHGIDNLLIVQDLDGVCMDLVKDPLTRTLDRRYVEAAAQMHGRFVVLTNGEHEGKRGVNRLVENALGDGQHASQAGCYLPGLAAGGVQLQDRYGTLSHPGVSDEEMEFLAALPKRMHAELHGRLPALMPQLNPDQLRNVIQQAVLDTQVSPTINLNGLFGYCSDDVPLQRRLQQMLQELMDDLLTLAEQAGLGSSFFLHVAPNLGCDREGRERLKPAQPGDVGSTDIQFMLRGAIKEAGLLVLINRHIAARSGHAPLGDQFNVRTAPRHHQALLDLCMEAIPAEQMPTLIGVGDTVTSTATPDGKGWLRGGSDRGFLTLLQALGEHYGRSNRVVLVDSSGGEVDRPSLTDGTLHGISDPEDPLHFDVVMPGGPKQYVQWFAQLAQAMAEPT
ncbi:MAG: glucosylglycerol 3-phosphatase [Synechococcus sp.]